MFTAKDVQALREQTGAGMMDCKRALTEADGNFDAAVKLLREKGLAAAAKKSGRVAADGMVYAGVADNGVGAIVEVNCETDFVAKNPTFQEFVKNIGEIVAQSNPADLDALKALPYPDGITVEEAVQQKVLTIGENIQIRRFTRFCDDTANACYIHMGGKIGVLTAFEVGDSSAAANAKFIEMGKNICMQIAAMTPLYLTRDEISEEYLANERDILTKQAIAEGKPEAIAAKMVEGRLSKQLGEICLVDQGYVRDDNLTVGKYIAAVAAELGFSIKPVKFVRYERGEGIEKREDDFAAEVAKMTGN